MAEPRTVRADANALNSEEIAALLPHRYPFALVDRILDYEPGQWAIGRKVGVGKASAWVDGKCAATAELTFVLTEAADNR